MAGMEDMVSMEETRERRSVVRKEAGRGHDQPVIATEEAEERLSIIIHERGRSGPSSAMKERFKSLRDAPLEGTTSEAQAKKPLIRRVPMLLRDHKNFAKYYEPRVIAVGPLHHGKSHLQPAEKLKLKLAALFIKENCLGMDVLCKILTEIKTLRECFIEEEARKFPDDEELMWMLFVDGCALLHYMKCTTKQLKDLKIKNDQIPFLQQDLFLLENQLPYRVLELLISSLSATNQQTHSDSIKKFFNRLAPEANKVTEGTPAHLLDLLRTKLLGLAPEKKQGHEKNEVPEEKDPSWQSFRNVIELKEAGIKLKLSKTNYLTDISFCSLLAAARLKLPSIVVDDSTGPKFMNLIAYEMCPDFQNNFEVTSYIYFLDSLIDEAKDVMELRKARILLNCLGSDDEVAKLFNEMCTDLVPNPDAYKSVKEDIEKHCNNKCFTWLAKAYYDHFSSPWTIIAFAGAVFALVLTGIQTWYAVYSP